MTTNEDQEVRMNEVAAVGQKCWWLTANPVASLSSSLGVWLLFSFTGLRVKTETL